MAYTTAALIEAELRIPNSASFSTSTIPTKAQVEGWIAEIDNTIDQMAGKSFAETSYTQYIDYDDSGEIYLQHVPVTAITTLKYSPYQLGSTDYPSWETKTEDTDFYVNDKGVITFINANFKPKGGNKKFEIVYTAGYATIPAYVQMLATKMTAKRVIDSVLSKDVNEKQSGKSISVGSISIVKPAQFGVGQYNILKTEIDDLSNQLLKTQGVVRYTNY